MIAHRSVTWARGCACGTGKVLLCLNTAILMAMISQYVAESNTYDIPFTPNFTYLSISIVLCHHRQKKPDVSDDAWHSTVCTATPAAS